VLQCVAVCCSVLQCVVVCCSVLQCVAVCCSVLKCVAVLGLATSCRALSRRDCACNRGVAVCCSVLQCVAVCCSAWISDILSSTVAPRLCLQHYSLIYASWNFWKVIVLLNLLCRMTIVLTFEKNCQSYSVSRHCNTLKHTATHCNTYMWHDSDSWHWNTLQHTATHCNTLQHTATQYNTLLQHII